MNISHKEIAFLAVKQFKAQQKPEELTALLEKLELLQPEIIVEIGFGSGGTLWAFSKISSVKHLINIDIKAFPDESTYIKEATTAKIDFIVGNSMKQGTVKEVLQVLNGKKVDFLHIDGCHDFDCVSADYEMYSPLVREGGLIALHDTVKHPEETKCKVDGIS